MCCHLNAFLIDQGITKCDDLSESLIDSFLESIEKTSGPRARLFAQAQCKRTAQTALRLLGRDQSEAIVRYLPHRFAET